MNDAFKSVFIKSASKPLKSDKINALLSHYAGTTNSELKYDYRLPTGTSTSADVINIEAQRYSRNRKKKMERSEYSVGENKVDQLEMEFTHHKEVVDLKLHILEQKVEAKIDSSLNQILSAINNVESRMNDKMNTIEANTIREINELKNQALTLNDVKVTIAEEIRNSSNLKHTRSGVYIAAGAGIVSVIALLFQIFG